MIVVSKLVSISVSGQAVADMRIAAHSAWEGRKP